MTPALAVRLRAVHLALLLGSLSFAIVVAALSALEVRVPVAVPRELGDVGVMLGATMLVLAPTASVVLRRKAHAAPEPERDAAAIRAAILPLALLEGAIVLNLGCWLLLGPMLPYAPIAAVLLVESAMLRPPLAAAN